ncbi:MAG: hypothetical protein JXR73_16405, partial [Candidatus Omnitrophica bacterium]|nr:hypothetical protein [Candidatus Omnitrophota bacterium]
MIFVKLLILFAFVVCVHSGRADISGDAIFSDGFETSDSNFPAWDGHSGNLEAAGPPSPLDGDYAMSADLSDGNARYVRDDLAAAETRYRARFVFDPNSVVMADGDRHTIFAGNDPANPAFSIQFRYSGGVYQISAQF